MQPAVWSPAYAVLMFFMWWTMMVAMMIPSAAPTILLFAGINRRQRARAAPYVSTGVFAAGYVVAWGGFCAVAVLAQWLLERVGLLSGWMDTTSTLLGACLLTAAGVWQLTPLKHACLRHCRSPVHYLTTHWRSGTKGAFVMGFGHGIFCLGCCWFLMGLLFYGGVMNLYWIAGLAAYVLLEKTVPRGHWLGGLVGVALLGWGVYLGVSLL
jgi:predicted metal-binding membrane protein